jgi:hypothetical protein
MLEHLLTSVLLCCRVDAGKVELDGATYAGLPLPFSITQLIWIEVVAVGGAEFYRNSELAPEKRCYPGGLFDPLKLASESEERAFNLKTAEIKHGRLAMLAFLGEPRCLLLPAALAGYVLSTTATVLDCVLIMLRFVLYGLAAGMVVDMACRLRRAGSVHRRGRSWLPGQVCQRPERPVKRSRECSSKCSGWNAASQPRALVRPTAAA